MIQWNYNYNFARGKSFRKDFEITSISQHDLGVDFTCYLQCSGMELSPRQFLSYMDSLGFKELVFLDDEKSLNDLYVIRLYILNEKFYNIKLLFSDKYNPIINKWKSKKRYITKKLDLEDFYITKIEEMQSKNLLPATTLLKWKKKKLDEEALNRIKTYREITTVNPKDYKNVVFSPEAQELLGGSWYVGDTDLFITTKEDFEKEKLTIRSYLKKNKYPKLDLPYPKSIYYRKFDFSSNEISSCGSLDKKTFYYCYNLPYEYYSQHKPHFRELFYDTEEKCWKSSSKSRKSLEGLINSVAENGFKQPLCFLLAENYQLIPIGCHTRILIATYLQLPTIPSVILVLPETFKGNKNVNNIELARKYLTPYILV